MAGIKTKNVDIIIGGGATGTAVAWFLKSVGRPSLWIKGRTNLIDEAIKVDRRSMENHAPVEDSVPNGPSGNLSSWGGRSLNSVVAKSSLLSAVRRYIDTGEKKLDVLGALDIETWRHRLDFADVLDTADVEILEGWVQLIDEDGATKKIEYVDSTGRDGLVETSGNVYVCAGGVGSAVILKNMLAKSPPGLAGVRYSGHVSASLKASCIDQDKVNVAVKQRYLKRAIQSPIVFEKILDDGTYIYAALRDSLNNKNAIALAARRLLKTRFGHAILPSKILEKSLSNLPLLPWIEILRLFDSRIIYQVLNLSFQKFILRRTVLLPPKRFKNGDNLSVHIQYNMGIDSSGFIEFNNNGVVNLHLPVPETPRSIFEVVNHDLRGALRSVGVETKFYEYEDLHSLFAKSVDGYHQFSTMYGLDWKRLVQDNGAFRSTSGVFFFNSGIFKLGVIPYPTTMTMCFAVGVLDEILTSR